MRLCVALAVAVGLVGVLAPVAAARAPRVTWTQLDSPMSLWFQAFPGGYVGASGSCWDETAPTIYTSRDGVHWTTPADPSIFATADPGFCLTFFAPVHGPAGFLLAQQGLDGATTIWKSTDGAHWARNAAPSLAEGDLFRIMPTAGGYLAADGGGDNYWTSTDGVDWTWVGSDGFKLEAGTPGVPMVAGGECSCAWFSVDGGKTWGQTGIPKHEKLLEGTARLGSLYYGDWEMGGTFTIYWTRDMRHWAPINTRGLNPGSLVRFGDRLYVVSYGDTLTGTVYSSADGRSWSPVKDGSGQAIQANALRVLAGRLFATDENGAISWVASLS
jgi:hypothetical protein